MGRPSETLLRTQQVLGSYSLAECIRNFLPYRAATSIHIGGRVPGGDCVTRRHRRKEPYPPLEEGTTAPRPVTKARTTKGWLDSGAASLNLQEPVEAHVRLYSAFQAPTKEHWNRIASFEELALSIPYKSYKAKQRYAAC